MGTDRGDARPVRTDEVRPPAGSVGDVPDPTPLPAAARDAILDWYAAHGRTLAFRATTDPYAILVSEAMAQQTQAARAGEAWIRFMEAFPTAEALAAATPADVLRAWQGLGYNRRALNLWRAARQIVEVHGGEVPADLRALEALPGVGPYTARAVAAIAFGMPVGAVDTNVRRVLGRMVAGDACRPRPGRASVPGRCGCCLRPTRGLDARRDGPRRDGLSTSAPGLCGLPGTGLVPIRGHRGRGPARSLPARGSPGLG